MRFLPSWTLAAFVAAFGLCLAQTLESPKANAPFSLEEVVKLVRAGVTEEIVIARIKRYNKPFDLNADEILELQKAGVSDKILAYLMDPSKPYTPAAPPPPAAVPDKKEPPPPPKDPLSLKVPGEPGVYWLAANEPGNESFELIELKPLVPMKSGGKIAKLTGGLKKGQTVGSLAGPSSRLHVPKTPNVFYGRIGTKVAIEDLILLRAEKGDGKRFVDFGPKPAKPVFPPDSIKQFVSKPVAEGFYRMEVAALPAGEYVFLILGSGDEKKGIVGKGYDFAVGPAGKGK
jgi:hypothetical protein